MKEIVFEIAQDADGGYTAEALGESIFTQADTWDELRVNVKESVKAFYFDSAPPASIRLHLFRDEVLAVAILAEVLHQPLSRHSSNPTTNTSSCRYSGTLGFTDWNSQFDPCRRCRAQKSAQRGCSPRGLACIRYSLRCEPRSWTMRAHGRTEPDSDSFNL